jgi:predicted nucleic acid-binding protein
VSYTVFMDTTLTIRADAVALMENYSDTPMDFAHATLVLLVEALDARDVLTLDRRGFAAYRTRKGRAMRLVLDMP